MDPKAKKISKKKRKRVPAPGASRFRAVCIGLAAAYLATVWLDGVGSNWPAKVTPGPWLYFAQVAALFVTAAPKVIEYRAEGWSCQERTWSEIDVLPYFRIDADHKENRFQRALQFHRKNRTVMRALDDFLVERVSASAGPKIGGVRFTSLRLPYPPPGEHIAPYERHPLASYPKDQRHDWYWTRASRRIERCGSLPKPDAPHEDDSDRPHDAESKALEP